MPRQDSQDVLQQLQRVKRHGRLSSPWKKPEIFFVILQRNHRSCKALECRFRLGVSLQKRANVKQQAERRHGFASF